MSESTAALELDLGADFNCPTCALGVPGGFVYCPRCRAKAEGREFDAGVIDRHERQYVFSLVVLSLGALAIPRLFRSQAFSKSEQAGLALLGLLNSGAVIVVCVLFARWFPLYLASLAGR